MNQTVYSFPPVSASNAKVLILGSMPGVASLEANQYYAHPRNQFWPVLIRLTGVPEDLDYPARTEFVRGKGIAIWDVLKACIRPGSLDSDISAEVPNDFPAFFAAHPEIRAVFFNGRKAQSAFKKLVLPDLPDFHVEQNLLPSTSPAHAGMSFEEKYRAWLQIKTFLTKS